MARWSYPSALFSHHVPPYLTIKRLIMNGGSEAKRKLGGHFGAAVGSSTNAKKTRGGWRDEVEPEEDAAQAATGSNGGAAKMPVDDNSDSEEMLDPGTPLPSEDEAEEQ